MRTHLGIAVPCDSNVGNEVSKRVAPCQDTGSKDSDRDIHQNAVGREDAHKLVGDKYDPVDRRDEGKENEDDLDVAAWRIFFLSQT